MSDAAKVGLLQKVMREAVQKSSSDPDYCPHHFGYLGQRLKGEEIPVTCMTCRKLVDCMLSMPKASEVLVSPVAPIKEELSASKVNHEVDTAEKAKMPVSYSTRETAKEELKTALKPDIKIKPSPREPLENQFKVEDLDMVYASWSKTVCIDRQSVLGWGKKIEEVEIETVKGKRARCKVHPIEDSEKRIIQVPDKVQLYLEIGKGELVTVRPVAKKLKR